MPDTIESFVARLQKEGVEAGQTAAQELIAKARRDAEEIIRQAQAQAQRTIDEAEARAAATLAKSRTDLELAARDVVLKLREALTKALKAVLAAGVHQQLADADFVGKLLYDIVIQYAKANAEGKTVIKINVTPEMRTQLTNWALQHLRDKPDMGNISLDLKGTLAEAGFEYQVDGANVEVTLSSVVESLLEIVSPNLRDLIQQAVAQDRP